MSEVRTETRRFQKCEFCKNEIELANGEKCLDTVRLPCIFYPSEGGLGVTVNNFSICENCLGELYDTLSQRFEVAEYEYGGTTVKESWRKSE